jgi:hypothetical protein
MWKNKLPEFVQIFLFCLLLVICTSPNSRSLLFIYFKASLSLSLSHTHTHMHIHTCCYTIVVCCLLSSWFGFCCRAPNPDTVLIIQTPLGVFSAKSLMQNKKRAGSRLISSNRTKLEEVSTIESTEDEPFSAARCRVYKRLKNNKKVPYIFISVSFYLSISILLSCFNRIPDGWFL